MNIILLIPVILSLILTLLFLPPWIRKSKKVNLLWVDMNKYDKPKIPGSGGLIVIMSFAISVLAYVAIKTFILNLNVTTIDLFALLTTIILASLIGLVDDFFGWMHGGLSTKLRIFLVLVAAIPLMVINAGSSLINIPFLGLVDVGLLYPIILIPLAIVGVTTTYNFLAGFNGLEAGQGIIILSFLSFVAYVTNSPWLALIGLIMVASLIGFYIYNKSPAKVFPGDIMTYAIGALIAGMAILGDFEKIALFIFIPYIAEVLLKLRGNLKKHSFGIPNKDNSLNEPYDKIYGLEHLAIRIIKKIKGKTYENEVTYLIMSIQIILCLLALIIFRSSLF